MLAAENMELPCDYYLIKVDLFRNDTLQQNEIKLKKVSFFIVRGEPFIIVLSYFCKPNELVEHFILLG